MRLILASAGIALLAGSVSATAADCTKGLLWPYVRHPGDCLTDAEIQAGKTGVYSGPATGQVDVSTIKPPPQLNSASPDAIQCSHSWYWPFGSGDCQATPTSTVTQVSPATNNSGAVVPSAPATSAAKPQAAVAPAAQPVQSAPPALKPQAADAPVAAVPIQIAQTNAAECHKGILWPFVRDDGDCATAAEAGKGKTSAAPISPGMPAAMPVSAGTIPPQVQPVAAVTPTTAVTCTKGTFWPFIRESGDCATAAEKANGNTPAVPNAATEPAAMPVSAVPPPSPPPAVQPATVASPATAAPCIKGTFWPFIRESGDCATAAEKGNGKTSAVPNAASEPVAMPVSGAPPPSVAPPVQPVAEANPATAATCTKGTFWPFIRESGDCATAAEKGNGKASAVPIDASAPVVNPVVVPAAATMPEQTAPAQNSGPPATNAPTCHKGLFWPFVRATGDCPTDADKGPQHNPS